MARWSEAQAAQRIVDALLGLPGTAQRCAFSDERGISTVKATPPTVEVAEYQSVMLPWHGPLHGTGTAGVIRVSAENERVHAARRPPPVVSTEVENPCREIMRSGRTQVRKRAIARDSGSLSARGPELAIRRNLFGKLRLSLEVVSCIPPGVCRHH